MTVPGSEARPIQRKVSRGVWPGTEVRFMEEGSTPGGGPDMPGGGPDIVDEVFAECAQSQRAAVGVKKC